MAGGDRIHRSKIGFTRGSKRDEAGNGVCEVKDDSCANEVMKLECGFFAQVDSGCRLKS